MDIIGDRKYVEIPGDKLHELPPLLVNLTVSLHLDKISEMARDIVDSEAMVQETVSNWLINEEYFDRQKMDLAQNLLDQYLEFLYFWHWGDGIVHWIHQCEETFQFSRSLRNVLRPDVWPHAGRRSFVDLIKDRSRLDTKVREQIESVDLAQAVGMRLAFRQPPPISCFSNQFLFYLNSPVATTAYQTWSNMVPDPVSSLPPERFTFEVINM